MWYVIRVESGRERLTLRLIETIVDMESLGRAFIPEVIFRKKRFGFWRNEYRPFVPGYIFFETAAPKDLFFELKKVPRMTALIRVEEDILSVSPEEEYFVKSFFSEGDVVGISQGHKEGDTVVIDSGPLIGREAIIKKIDAHHRTAVVATQMFGQTMELTLGLLMLRPNELSPDEKLPDQI